MAQAVPVRVRPWVPPESTLFQVVESAESLEYAIDFEIFENARIERCGHFFYFLFTKPVKLQDRLCRVDGLRIIHR